MKRNSKEKFLALQKAKAPTEAKKVRKQDKKRAAVDMSGPGFVPGPIVKKNHHAKTVIPKLKEEGEPNNV